MTDLFRPWCLATLVLLVSSWTAFATPSTGVAQVFDPDATSSYHASNPILFELGVPTFFEIPPLSCQVVKDLLSLNTQDAVTPDSQQLNDLAGDCDNPPDIDLTNCDFLFGDIEDDLSCDQCEVADDTAGLGSLGGGAGMGGPAFLGDGGGWGGGGFGSPGVTGASASSSSSSKVHVKVVVPEPSTYALLGSMMFVALLAIGLERKRAEP